MTNLNQAIAFYHSLLTPSVAQESNAQLEDQQKRRGLFFGTRPLCSVLRPRFLTVQQHQFLRRALKVMLPAFAKAEAAALSNSTVLDQFMLSDWEKQLVPFDPGFVSSPNGRMDCFWVTDEIGDGTLMMTEYNAETPAGGGYSDELSEIFHALPAMRAFKARYECYDLPVRNLMLHQLNTCFKAWGVRGNERMNIGIVDWKEVPTYSEFLIYQRYFRSQGYACEIVDPREVEYANGKLMGRGEDGKPFHITMIYKRVLLSELVTRSPQGLAHPIIRAVNDRAVCMVNPYRCKILHQKASLAVLSDEANAHLFSADELRAIHTYIPWTRRLSERHTQYEGARVDLLPFLRDNKDIFVLKPNDEYGGTGIVLGWTVSQTEWEQKLSEYVQAQTIVQRRVAIPSEPYPSLKDGAAHIYNRMLDTDPYVWNEDYASGCLTRLSTADLLNVTAGGGSTVPTFVIEER